MALSWASGPRTDAGFYYRGLSNTEGEGLWVVDVTEQSSQLRISAPRRLFRPDGFADEFDITRDGRHLVMVRQDATPPVRQFQIVIKPLELAGAP